MQKVGLSGSAVEQAEEVYRAIDKERLSKQIAAGDIRAAREIILTQARRTDPAGESG
jgi:CPA2 family monovalent cation:H+ antiporter-2/glutathione-regulated potassium-efflux system protein KefB